MTNFIISGTTGKRQVGLVHERNLQILQFEIFKVYSSMAPPIVTEIFKIYSSIVPPIATEIFKIYSSTAPPIATQIFSNRNLKYKLRHSVVIIENLSRFYKNDVLIRTSENCSVIFSTKYDVLQYYVKRSNLSHLFSISCLTIYLNGNNEIKTNHYSRDSNP